jgi:hypothetical protein
MDCVPALFRLLYLGLISLVTTAGKCTVILYLDLTIGFSLSSASSIWHLEIVFWMAFCITLQCTSLRSVPKATIQQESLQSTLSLPVASSSPFQHVNLASGQTALRKLDSVSERKLDSVSEC